MALHSGFGFKMCVPRTINQIGSCYNKIEKSTTTEGRHTQYLLVCLKRTGHKLPARSFYFGLLHSIISLCWPSTTYKTVVLCWLYLCDMANVVNFHPLYSIIGCRCCIGGGDKKRHLKVPTFDNSLAIKCSL